MFRNLLFTIIILLPQFTLAQDNIALVGSHIETKNFNKEKSSNKVFESNFELYDRIILVEAELNGIKGKYILDTGSPMLLINQKPNNNESIIGGISKNCKGEIVNVKEFVWAGISKKYIEAVAIDLSGLEKSIGTSISGLIGQNIFQNYELYLDVSGQVIKLYKTRKSELHKNRSFKEKINFSMQSHIPIITVKIDGKKYRFGIDTGSEVNVLNKKLRGKLDAQLFGSKASQLVGVDGNPQNLESATLNDFKIKGNEFRNFDFLLMDFSILEESFDMKLDGILGYPFLAQNQISINYKKQKIYLW